MNPRFIPSCNNYQNASPGTAEKFRAASEVIGAFRGKLIEDFAFDDDDIECEFRMALAEMEMARLRLERISRKL